jgi:hypothetical protein
VAKREIGDVLDSFGELLRGGRRGERQRGRFLFFVSEQSRSS